MKKTVTILMLVIMLATLLVQPVAAAGLEAKIETKTTSAKPGDTIDFTIAVSGDAVCQSLGLMFNIDLDVFEVVKGKCTIKGADVSSFNKERGFVAMYLESKVPSGEIGTVVLRVRDNAPAGDAEVTFKTSAKDEKSASVPFTCNSVKIKIQGASSPAEKPTTPEQKPTTPEVKPTTPEVKPTTPEVKPTTPEVKPTTPVDNPAETTATVPSTEAATVPEDTTAPKSDTTTDTAPDTATVPSAPSEPGKQEEGGNDATWGIVGAILAVLIIGGIVAYLYIAKKRQK